MASFLEAHRQRLLCAQALVDRSFYVGQRLPSPSRLQFEMPRADNAQLVQSSDCVEEVASRGDDYADLRLISVKNRPGDQIENCVDFIAKTKHPKTA